MSGMADEMAARMRADGVNTTPPAGDGSPAPGTVDTAAPSTPSAGTSNTDTSGGTPGPIPYSRFKEVNDALQDLRPYEELRNVGYDAASLKQLAALDAAYRTDPRGTVSSIVDQMPDLADEVKAVIKEHLGAEVGTTPANASATPTVAETNDEPPQWAKPLIEDYANRRSQAEDTQRQQFLGAMVNRWKELDNQAGIETAEKTALRFIQATLASGQQFDTVEQVVDAARQDLLEYRESTLNSVRVPPRPRSGGTGLPVTVPGGGLPTAPPVKHANIRDATRAALAAIQSGELS